MDESNNKMKILKLGPPNVRGIYDVAEDQIYLNSCVLETDDPAIATEAVAHLSRYRQQLLDILNYLEVLKNDPAKAAGPEFEKIRLIKENYDNIIYPWKEGPINPKEPALFWVSLEGIKDANNGKVDWEKIKQILNQ